ncbi:hypothetical protein SteCoe_21006 [Stentor coeruleus]|uniref:Transcription initiation factor TFIID subunit 10 n=1 Tax=Stentor coeruleus TaxID=5963 RepID=A0A1R2BQS7_9CILI|nr:hypothetical protein SteCoe_21006 [Stentor coeruleus]
MDLLPLIDKVESSKTIIPPEYVAKILEIKGCFSSDPICSKVVAIAVQNFLTNILNEVLDIIPGKPVTILNNKGKDQKLSLNMRDLAGALEVLGVKVEKPIFYADKPLGSEHK